MPLGTLVWDGYPELPAPTEPPEPVPVVSRLRGGSLVPEEPDDVLVGEGEGLGDDSVGLDVGAGVVGEVDGSAVGDGELFGLGEVLGAGAGSEEGPSL